MVNRVILIGNLGADPEVRHLESGAAVARIRMATNESYKDKSGQWQDRTEWHDVVAWRALAERAEQSLKKGMTIYVDGKLTHRSWEDKEGNPRRTTEVVANYIRILSRRDQPSSASASGSYSTPSEAPSDEPSFDEESAGDDLPF